MLEKIVPTSRTRTKQGPQKGTKKKKNGYKSQCKIDAKNEDQPPHNVIFVPGGKITAGGGFEAMAFSSGR